MNKKTNKKANTQNRPYGIIITVITLTAFLYLIFTFASLRSDMNEKKAKLLELSAQYEQQVAENDELQKLIDDGNEKQYIEHIARQQRGYVYPDERVYYDITPGSY